jgi:hypothetical protein
MHLPDTTATRTSQFVGPLGKLSRRLAGETSEAIDPTASYCVGNLPNFHQGYMSSLRGAMIRRFRRHIAADNRVEVSALAKYDRWPLARGLRGWPALR